MNKKVEILNRPNHLSSEVCLKMISVGLNPLIHEHCFKYLAYLDTPELVKLWEGPEWKFELDEFQLTQIQEEIKSLGKDISPSIARQFVIQYLLDLLPECQIQATDEKTKELVNKIINEPPLYFKKNPTFFEKLEKINKTNNILKMNELNYKSKQKKKSILIDEDIYNTLALFCKRNKYKIKDIVEDMIRTSINNYEDKH